MSLDDISISLSLTLSLILSILSTAYCLHQRIDTPSQNIHIALKMADEIEYKLEDVKATLVAPDDIDSTFRSSCIGMNDKYS